MRIALTANYPHADPLENPAAMIPGALNTPIERSTANERQK